MSSNPAIRADTLSALSLRSRRSDMSSALQSYLDRHFVTADELLKHADISKERLQELITHKWIPAPSYIVLADGTLNSCAFGRFEQTDAKPAEYFSTTAVDWVQSVERDLAQNQDPAATFAQQYWQALAQLELQLTSQSDLFDVNAINRDKAEKWLPTIRQYFLDGIFGVCVVAPRSLLPILRKEVSQAALTRLTENGQKKSYSEEEKIQLRPIMAIYDQVCMPFSPLEYSRCSRKRLLDDLKSAVFE